MTAAGRWGFAHAWAAPIALFAAVALVAALAATQPSVQRWSGDVRLFEHYAGLLFTGHLGATPFLSWYPPLALVPLAPPVALGFGGLYFAGLVAEMAAVAAACLAIVRDAARRLDLPPRTYLFAALAIVTLPLFAWRYDLVPATLTLGGVLLLVGRRWGWGSAMIGIAAGLKIYAAPLGVLAVAYAWRRAGREGAGRAAIGFVAAGIASVAPYLLFPPASPLDLLAFSASRPLQIETLPGAVIALAAAVGGPGVDVGYGSGSFNVGAPLATSVLEGLRVVQPLLVLAALGVAVIAIRRAPDGAAGPTLVHATVAILLAVVVSNRVLSPQYLVWLLPFVPLLSGVVRWPLIVAIVLSAAVFPWLYNAVVALDPLVLGVVVTRNACLAMALVAALVQLARRPQRASEAATITVVARGAV